MKKKLLIVITLSILVFLIAGCTNRKTTGGGNDTAGLNMITVNQLKTELKTGLNKNTVIVDLREPMLYKEGHIQGAVLIPFADFEKEYSKLDKNKRIVLVCHMGSMGEAAGQFLVEHGYKQVYNVDGGMRAWEGK